MASEKRTTAREIAQNYAAAVRGEPSVRSLWVSVHQDCVELWLLIDPSDADTERRLYNASLPVYDAFPDASIRLNVINPQHYVRVDMDAILPEGAQEISLRSA